MDVPAARSREQRKRDTLDRLEHDVDAWIATADPVGGTPHLTPLSFRWDGTTLLLSTEASTPAGRDMVATKEVRLGLGLTRDVILIEGSDDVVEISERATAEADDFAVKAGFDPRESGGHYLYFRVHPQRLMAWREVNELAGRELVRNGRWVD